MKFLLGGLLVFSVIGLCAEYVNPMNNVKGASVASLPQVLADAEKGLSADASANVKMDLAVAYGLAYLKQTDAPTWDAYFKIVSDKAKELGVEDQIDTTANVFEVLRKWWIGNKSNRSLIDPALAYINQHKNKVTVLKAAALCYDLNDYTGCLDWLNGSGEVSGHALRSYIELGQVDVAIDYYYTTLENERWSANDARRLFPVVWNVILKAYGTDSGKMAEFKARNARYASQYTTKLYDAEDPGNSPWRPLVTILTAQSK